MFRAADGPKDMDTGYLHLTYPTSRNRRGAVLQLPGADRMRFVGLRARRRASHMQEWICEVAPTP